MAANEEVTVDQQQPLMRHSASIKDHNNKGTEPGVSSHYFTHDENKNSILRRENTHQAAEDEREDGTQQNKY